MLQYLLPGAAGRSAPAACMCSSSPGGCQSSTCSSHASCMACSARSCASTSSRCKLMISSGHGRYKLRRYNEPLCRAILTHSQNNMEVCSQPEITNTRSQPCLRAIIGPNLCASILVTCSFRLLARSLVHAWSFFIYYSQLAAIQFSVALWRIKAVQTDAWKSNLSSERDNALSDAGVMAMPHASRCRELRACLLHAGQRAAGGRDVKALAGRCQRWTGPRRAVLRLQVQAPVRCAMHHMRT